MLVSELAWQVSGRRPHRNLKGMNAMKTILIGAALLLLPATAFAAGHMEKKDAATAMPAATPGDPAMPAAAVPGDAATPAKLPRCSAKIQDSCDQSMTTEKNALSYYPAESRDAGNNKIAGVKAMPKPM